MASVAAFAAWVYAIAPLELLDDALLPPALALNAGEPVPERDLAAAVERFRMERDNLRCRADLLRAGGTLLLASANAAQDGAERRARDAEAESAFRASLACSPPQGNLWLVLAQLRAAEQRFDDDFFDMIEKSHALAPREAWIMGRRAGLVANTPVELPPRIGSILENDLNRLLESPGWRTVVQIHRQSTPTGRLRVIEALDRAPAELRGRFHFHVLRGG